MDEIPFIPSAPADEDDQQAIDQMIQSVLGSNQTSIAVSDQDARWDMMDDRAFFHGDDYHPPAANHLTGPGVQEDGSLRQRDREGSPSEPAKQQKQTSSDKRSTIGQKRQLSSDKEQGRNPTGGGRGNRPHPSFNRQADSKPATDPQVGSSRGRSRTYAKGNAPHPQVYRKPVDPPPALNRRVGSMSATYPPVQSIRASAPLSGSMQNQFLQYGPMPTPVLQSSWMPTPGLQLDLTQAPGLQPSFMPAPNLQSRSMPASDHQNSPTPAPVLQPGSMPAPSSPTKSSRSGRGKKKRDRAKKDHEFYCNDHNRGFGSKHDLARHYQDVHKTTIDGTPIESFRCTWGNCKKEFMRKANLMSHIESQHIRKSTSNENLNNGSSSVQLAEAYAPPVAIQQASQKGTWPLQPLSPNRTVSNHPKSSSESKDSSGKYTAEKLHFLKEELHLPLNLIMVIELVDQCVGFSKKAQQWKELEDQAFERLVNQALDPERRAEDQALLNNATEKRIDFTARITQSRLELTNAVFRLQNGAAPAGAPSGQLTAVQQTGGSLI